MERRPSPRGAADWRRAPLPLAEPAAAGAARRARALRVEPFRLSTPPPERATAEAMFSTLLHEPNVVAGAPGAGAGERVAGPTYSVRGKKRAMHAAATSKEDWAPAAGAAAAGLLGASAAARAIPLQPGSHYK